jgi:hypothetical protein
MKPPANNQVPYIWQQHYYMITLQPSWMTFDIIIYDAYNRKIGYMERTIDKGEDIRIYTAKDKKHELLFLQCALMDITPVGGGRFGRATRFIGKMGYSIYDRIKGEKVGSISRLMDLSKDEIQIYDGNDNHIALIYPDPQIQIGPRPYVFNMQGRVLATITQEKGFNTRTKYVDARYDPQFHLDRRLILSVGVLI